MESPSPCSTGLPWWHGGWCCARALFDQVVIHKELALGADFDACGAHFHGLHNALVAQMPPCCLQRLEIHLLSFHK